MKPECASNLLFVHLLLNDKKRGEHLHKGSILKKISISFIIHT